MTERIEEDPQVVCTAVRNRNLKIVEDLLKDGADVNTIDSTYQIGGVTLLHSAIHTDHFEMVKLLIQYGADLNVKDSRRRSPLDNAKQSWNPEMKELLLINGAVVRKHNALHAAVNSGNLEIVEELLKDGVDVNIIEDSDLIIGMTILHSAVCKKQLEMTKLLIAYGANVNLKDSWGTTPLAEALHIKHTEMVELLLANGANTKKDPNVLYTAAMNGYVKIVEEILKDGVDINMIDSTNYGQGKMLLHSAVRVSHVEMATLLIKYGANVNGKASSGTTPLADALRINNTEMIKLLLANRADTKGDPNILYAAVMNGYVKIVEDLLKDGVDVNTIDDSNDKEGMTILHSAVCMGQEKMTELLIQYGADVNIKDSSGKTPLAHALQIHATKIVEQLIIIGADIKEDCNILYAAVMTGNVEIVEEILKDGVDDNKIDSKNYIADGMLLHSIVGWKNVEMAKVLIKHGANVNVRDSFGATPLVTAIYNWDTEMTKLLLINGADIEEDNILSSAVMIGSVNIEELLNEHREDISDNTNLLNGMTYLHSTVAWSQVERAKLLIEHGANINAKDNYGRTPLHYAILNQDTEMIVLFLSNGADLDEDLEVLFKHYDHEIPCIVLLKEHIAMEKAANLYVSEKNLHWIINDDETNYFLNKCEAEIEVMKSEKIGNSCVSFYDILTKNISKLTKNERIVKVLKLNDYKKKFPTYASMINNRFRRGVKRNELLEQVRNKFSPSLSESLNELPLLCTEKIFTYLNDFDLRFLLFECELFNKYICI